MRVALAAGIGTVVTGDAVVRKACMINTRWQPGTDVMADITFIGGLNMVIGFAQRGCSIVAGRANTNDFVVIHIGRRNWLPRYGSRCMAGIAVICAIDMCV